MLKEKNKKTSEKFWRIKAGIGMANIIGDNMGSPKVTLAYKLSIGLECPFDKIWSLQTGVSFVSKGTNHTICLLYTSLMQELLLQER